MSRFASKVYAAATQDQKPVNAPLSAVSVTEEWQDHSVATKYRIGVALEYHAWIANDKGANGDALTLAVRTAKRAIVEEVFGEFRSHCIVIESALMRDDIDAAREALRVMQHCMFSEGTL